MPSTLENFRRLQAFLRATLNVIQDPCYCEDCEEVRDGRRDIILQLRVVLPDGRGCSFRRGCRAVHGMFLKREQDLDHRSISKPLKTMVGILRLCVDPTTTRVLWYLCQHFRYEGSPEAGTHVLGLDYHYDSHGSLVWAVAPMDNSISRGRREDIRLQQRVGMVGFVMEMGDIPPTRLDRALWDWEAQP